MITKHCRTNGRWGGREEYVMRRDKGRNAGTHAAKLTAFPECGNPSVC